MDSETASLLYNWAPILLIIVFWLFIMRKVKPDGQTKYVERRLAFMDRQEQLLERIANALERRNARGE